MSATFTIARGKAIDANGSPNFSMITQHDAVTLPQFRELLREAQKQDIATSFERLSEIRAAKERGDKAATAMLANLKHTPWFVCGTFTGNRRHKSTMEDCTAFVGDADQPGTMRAKLLAALDALSVAYIVATSTSHGCAGQDRYRVIVPFAEPIAPERYPEVWEWFNAHLTGMLDPGAKDPTRLNFLPRIPRGAVGHEVICHEGEWFDPSTIEAKSAPPVTVQAQQRSGWTIPQLRDYITKYRDPSAPEPVWFKTIRMLQFETAGSDEGLALADGWSKGGSNYSGREAIELKWHSPSWNDPTTPAITIDTLRKEHPVAATADFKLVEPPAEAATPPQTGVEPLNFPPITLRRLPPDWSITRPPEREWAIQDLAPKRATTLDISVGGLGKSNLALLKAVCVATGFDFCGHKCSPGRVVIVSAEDDFVEIQRRLFNLANRMTLLQFTPRAMQMVRENIEVLDVKGMRKDASISTALTKSDHRTVIVTPFARHLAKQIGTASLIVIDTVSRFNGAEENSNEAAAVFIDALELIAEETDSAVLALAHTGLKGRGGDVDQYSARGASAFSDNARSVFVLAPLHTDLVNQLADESDISKAGRNDLLKLCHVKSNYSRRVDDMYFERHPSGVLLPTHLRLDLTSDVDLVGHLLTKIGSAEVTRNKVRDDWHLYFPASVKRESAMQAFDAAVATGRFELAGVSANGKSKRYRVKPIDATFKPNGADAPARNKESSPTVAA
jgi:AAA domain